MCACLRMVVQFPTAESAKNRVYHKKVGTPDVKNEEKHAHKQHMLINKIVCKDVLTWACQQQENQDDY